MIFSRFLRRFLIGYLVLHLLAALSFVFVLSRMARTKMIDDTNGQMHAIALMLKAHIAELPDQLADKTIVDHIKRLGEETNFRFTVISTDGIVLADSETGTQDIGPHGSRPEIIEAQRSGLGFKQRYSDTLQKPMLYLAIPFSSDSENEPQGYIRVAAPAVSINQSIRAIQSYILVFAIIASTLTAFLMLIFSSRAMKPLQLFADSARKIGVGQYDEIPTLHERNDEWKMLGQAFTQMRSELASREIRLAENSRRLEAVLSSMIEGVLAIDADGTVKAVNRAARKMLSLEQDELVDRRLMDIVRYPELHQAVQRTQQNRAFSKTEFQTHAEPRKSINARVSALSNESRPGVAIVLQDVTELRALENMRRDFAANVSHELKTPLASIKAYAETLALGAIHDPEKNLQFVQQIEQQADILDNQIHDLLELSRLESGAKTELDAVSLYAVAIQCIQEFESEANDREIELALESESREIPVKAAAQGIRTILKNLVSNSLHYTSKGGRVSIRLRTESGMGLIEVEDSGIGISPEHQARVFERFYRVDKARSREMGGTGLGLSIVKHLVQSFGGDVTLNSELGRGSLFCVRIPLA